MHCVRDSQQSRTYGAAKWLTQKAFSIGDLFFGSPLSISVQRLLNLDQQKLAVRLMITQHYVWTPEISGAENAPKN